MNVLPNGRKACKVTLSWADGTTYCNDDQRIRAELFTKLIASLELPQLKQLAQILNAHVLALAEKDLLNRDLKTVVPSINF
jgi:hypothetical protein